MWKIREKEWRTTTLTEGGTFSGFNGEGHGMKVAFGLVFVGKGCMGDMFGGFDGEGDESNIKIRVYSEGCVSGEERKKPYIAPGLLERKSFLYKFNEYF
ncbi:hypothetical protein VNO78_25637 [Psophocarpus tetragonolobus]|uniref:Uncharacterized protein n=1 Tax=Psophocarpus tetragonolobus TaxID=3891 RepID=A0AAN9S682_PSOTE